MNKSIPLQILFVKYGPAFNIHIMAGFSCECSLGSDFDCTEHHNQLLADIPYQ